MEENNNIKQVIGLTIAIIVVIILILTLSTLKHQRKVYTCEFGRIKGTTCEITETVASKQTCEEDFKLENNKCIKEYTVQPIRELGCPEGFTEEDNLCISVETRERNANGNCPTGTRLINDACHETTRRTNVDVCETGNLVDGICEIKEEKEIKLVCEEEYKLNDSKKCEKIVIKDAVLK